MSARYNMRTSIATVGSVFFGVGTDPNKDDYEKDTTGVMITGSDKVFSKGKKVCRVGDFGVSEAGTLTVVIKGSDIINVENKPVAKEGSLIATEVLGLIIKGEPAVQVG